MKALHLLIALLIPASIQAQAPLKACGTITRSTKLTSDCTAPLIVKANNIKIDLNGFAVRNKPASNSPKDQGNIDISNRRHVTITNGLVEGLYNSCLRIQGGHSNRIMNVALSVGTDGTGAAFYRTKKNVFQNITMSGRGLRAAFLVDSHKNRIDRVTTEKSAYFDEGLNISGNHNLVTRVKDERAFDFSVIISGSSNRVTDSRFWPFSGDAIQILGRGHTVNRNDIRSVNVGVLVVGTRTTVTSNTIRGTKQGIYIIVLGNNEIRGNKIAYSDGTAIYVGEPDNVTRENDIWNAHKIGILVSASGNTIRSNNVRNSGVADMFDNLNCGANKWRKNSFLTDSEGDGPRAGCIR